jgi:multidrug efflux pump
VLLSNFAIKNRSTVFMLIVLIVFMGGFSYVTLPREAAPEVKIPNVFVTTTNRGVSPTDIETSITMEIEQKLAGMTGVEEITSTSAEGLSQINIEFTPDVDIEVALQRVRDKVDLAKGELPDEADEPIITEINIAEFPIMMINITGDLEPIRLKEIADQLEEALEAISGVLNCDVLGYREREIRIEIDPSRLAAYGLTLAELINTVPAEHLNTSAGGLESPTMTYFFRVPAEIETPVELLEFPLMTRNGQIIYLSDIATVRDTFEDPTSFARLDGQTSITVSLQKRVGADILKIAAAAEHIVERARELAPRGVEFSITMDRSDDIKMMVSDLENNIITGLILVAVVLLLFMGPRMSLIVALAIPLSMLMSFAILQMLGFTLNMVVLFSLILALGMLVDNAIVIVENIYRHMQMGKTRIKAAMDGTGEVAWPVIASTATTIAAFSPLLFWPGIMGDFMKYLPITLIITLTSSLFVALIISPVVCSLIGPGKTKKAEKKHWFLNGYRRLLASAERFWYITLALAAVLLVMMISLYGQFGAGMEFFPKTDPKNALINVRCPQGTTIYYTDAIIMEMERRAEVYRSDLEFVNANTGSGGSNMFGGGSGGSHTGNVTLTFYDFEDRKRPSREVIDQLRRDIDNVPGAEIKIEEEQGGPPTGEVVEVRIIGEEFDRLAQLAEEVKLIIGDIPGLVSLRSDYEGSRPELAVDPNRHRAMLSGTNTRLVGDFLKTAIFGRDVGTYRLFNDEYDITIRLPAIERLSLNNILNLQIPNATGQAVPLSTVSTFRYAGGYGTIKRIDQQRVVTLTAAAEGRPDSEVLQDVKDRIDAAIASGELELGGGYRVEYAGQDEEQAKAAAFLGKAFFVALLLIVMILVLQFNTFTAPLIIMSTVLLSLIGVFGGLLICNMPFGIVMTGIGVISLAGVVVNNAIVLLDCTRQLQKEGMEVVDAAIEAGATRLRPVLLTATTTIFGLIPMATGVAFDFHTFQMVWASESSQFWSSMATAVIFGLAFATMLTLVVVPTLYTTLFRFARLFGKGGLERNEG